MSDSVVLSTAEMYEADRLTIEQGRSGLALMEAAGRAVTDEICKVWPEPRETVILAGPGNNGGDGFVIARLLKEQGWPVRLAAMTAIDQLKGDARYNADRWDGRIEPLSMEILSGNPLVVDALFGSGLARDIEGKVADLIEACNARKLDVVAVDIPSGVDGNSGRVLGTAAVAQVTVTFFRAKRGHLLSPGRGFCGRIVVADIGIDEAVLDVIKPKTFVNAPALWLPWFPWPQPDAHKYHRGHGVIWGGSVMTGAARLAARAARRAGAGLVTIACDPDAGPIYRQGDPGTIVADCESPDAFGTLLTDTRKNALLVGPGAGVGLKTAELAITAAKTGRPLVLDADALTSFSDDAETLFEAITGPTILTPHEGEFTRLFGSTDSGEQSKIDRALIAAKRSGATIILKGPDSVIAEPDGLVAINANAPADLATAGSGDVLSGLVLGLLASGMPAWRAALAAVWCHGAAAKSIGPGLIAEDLSDALPAVLAGLKGKAIELGVI